MTPLGALLALGIGLVLGLVGGGGSILTQPVLHKVLGLSAESAIVLGYPIVGVTALVGAVRHLRAGTITLATFPNDAGLEAVGNNLYLETPASGNATIANPGAEGYGTLLQGFLETSNVNAVSEVSELISAQRAYEMNSKVITTTDEMLRSTTNLR